MECLIRSCRSLNRINIEELESWLKEITPGKWHVYYDDIGNVEVHCEKSQSGKISTLTEIDAIDGTCMGEYLADAKLMALAPELAERVIELEDENYRFKKMPVWHDAKKELPEIGAEVLVAINNDYNSGKYFFFTASVFRDEGSGKVVFDDDRFSYSADAIVAWCALPKFNTGDPQ